MLNLNLSVRYVRTVLTYVTDKLRFNMGEGLYTGIALINLHKAFDTVSHAILATKLKDVGMNGPTVSWFEFYLTGKKKVS